MAAVGDSNVHVKVHGTTFSGIYEVVGAMLELTSADFGDRSVEIGATAPLLLAERLLREMAEEAVRSGSVFVRDDGTVATPMNGSNR